MSRHEFRIKYTRTAAVYSSDHRVHILLEMKQGQCICPFSWSVHCNLTGDGKCNERGLAGWRAPQLSPDWANFTLMMECTPESSRYTALCTLWFRPNLFQHNVSKPLPPPTTPQHPSKGMDRTGTHRPRDASSQSFPLRTHRLGTNWSCTIKTTERNGI